MPQLMVDILELGLDMGGEVSPGANPECGPLLNAYCSPPYQCTASKEGNCDLQLLPVISGSTHCAILCQIKQPVLKLTCVTFIFLWFVQLQLSSSFATNGCSWCLHCRPCFHCHSHESCMPSCIYFSHHILDQSRCCNSDMG